jgi:hypothetical protein
MAVASTYEKKRAPAATRALSPTRISWPATAVTRVKPKWPPAVTPASADRTTAAEVMQPRAPVFSVVAAFGAESFQG